MKIAYKILKSLVCDFTRATHPTIMRRKHFSNKAECHPAPSAHRTLLGGMVCTSAFCQGHALLRGCLWKGDSQLWGTANVLTLVERPS